jgi:transposase
MKSEASQDTIVATPETSAAESAPRAGGIVKWEELDGEARYRIVEMALDGHMKTKDICETFGVSRQTLYRAMDAVRKASTTALEPKVRGRKPTPVTEVQRRELESQRADAQKDRDRWKTRYEVTRTLLDLYLKYDKEVGPQEEKKRAPERKGSGAPTGSEHSSTGTRSSTDGEAT